MKYHRAAQSRKLRKSSARPLVQASPANPITLTEDGNADDEYLKAHPEIETYTRPMTGDELAEYATNVPDGYVAVGGTMRVIRCMIQLPELPGMPRFRGQLRGWRCDPVEIECQLIAPQAEARP
jgi:hypothetical protein